MPASRYSAEVHERLVGSILIGNTDEMAAEAAHLGRRTLYDWLARGREADARIGAASLDIASEELERVNGLPQAERDRYLLDLAGIAERDRDMYRLFRDVGFARAQNAEREMANITDVARGYTYEEVREERWDQINREGEVVRLSKTVTIRRHERDWRAAAWKLEHSPVLKDLYARSMMTRMEVTGAQGGPVQIDSPETTAEAVAALRRDAIRLIRPDASEEELA
jgi:hypothetical protein